MKTLRNLFLNELADACDASRRTARFLSRMSRAASGVHLKRALRTHATETAGRIAPLERVFARFGARAKGRTCEVTTGLLQEAAEILDEFKGSPAIDAALISATQKIEHYAIVSFGCLREWADLLGQPAAGIALRGLLDRARSADETFSQLAQHRSNARALGENFAESRRRDPRAAAR